jgi:hypothetical protein
MLLRHAGWIFAFVGLGGCAWVPDLPPHFIVRPADVLDQVECQLKNAVVAQFPDHKWLKSWGVQMTLTLQVERSAGVGASVDWSIPVGLNRSIRSFSISPAMDGSGRATRTGSVTYTLLINDVLKRNCGNDAINSNRPYFQGDIGVGSWLTEVTSSTGLDDVVQVPDQFGHTLEFGISVNGSVKPTVTFVNLSASGNIEGHIIDTYTLVLAFSDAQAPPPKHVFVTNWPSSLVEGGERFTSQSIRRTFRRGVEPPRIPTGVSPQLRDRLDRITQQLQLTGVTFRR